MNKDLFFTSPGKQLEGERADLLLPDARRLLFQAKLVAQAAGVPVYGLSRRLLDGSVVSAAVAGDVERVKGKTQPVTEDSEVEQAADEARLLFNRLVWMPEGLVITPKSPAFAPSGWGMPQTADKRGTPGGKLREVIINRFRDNQYPDAIYKMLGGRADDPIRLCAAPIFFADWELESSDFGIGAYIGGNFLPQFSKRYARNYAEPETTVWRCHRPASALNAENPARAAIRAETNMARAQVGQEALNLPLRGREGALSTDILYQQRSANFIGHDSTGYKPLHRTFSERVDRYSFSELYGENLLFNSRRDAATKAFGVAAVGQWINSPPHYQNIIRDWSETALYPTLDSAAQNNGTTEFRNRQLPPYSINSQTQAIVPAFRGSTATQIFHSYRYFANAVQSGDLDSLSANFSTYAGKFSATKPRVSIPTITANAGQGFFFHNLNIESALNNNRRTPREQTIYVFNTPIYLPGVSADGQYALMPIAATVVDFDFPIPKIRLVYHALALDGIQPMKFVLQEFAVHDARNTTVTLAEFVFPENVGRASRPMFSASGKKVVFSYSSVVKPVLPHLIFGDVVERAATDGEEIHFVECADSSFSEYLTESLEIDPYEINGLSGTSGTLIFKQRCVGECKLFADYAEEELVYLSVVVNSSSEQTTTRLNPDGTFRSTNAISLRGSLRFTDGTTLEYLHTDSGDDFGVTGYFRHIVYLDITRREDAVYMHYDASGSEFPNIDAQLFKNTTELRAKTNFIGNSFNESAVASRNGLAAFSGITTANALYFLNAAGVASLRPYHGFVPSSAGGFFALHATNRVVGSFIAVISTLKACLVPHKAVLTEFISDVYQGRPSENFSDLESGIIGSSGIPKGTELTRDFSTVIGPQIMGYFPSINVNESQAALYKAEHIFAGRINTTLGGNEFGFQGDDQYYLHSSLDLRAITGVPDLSNNVLPIGVI